MMTVVMAMITGDGWIKLITAHLVNQLAQRGNTNVTTD